MADASQSDELELLEHEREIEQMILRAPVPLCRNACRSAISYLRRAWKLRELDPPLAIFCCITAEEEAVRAIYHALERHRYAGAERLRWWNHRQKAVVLPFLYAIGESLRDVQGLALSVVPDRSQAQLRLRTRWITTAPNGEKVAIYPVPPLNANATIGGDEPDFTAELTRVFGGNELPQLRKAMRARANERNELLYASEKGLPGVSGPIDEEIRRYRGNVFALLTFFVLVDEHSMVQGLAQQALTAFLRALDVLRDEKGGVSTSVSE